jgi:hypothetical protein
MKDEDADLSTLGELLRSERRDDAALEAVARGETSSAEVTELESRAEGDAELAAILAACRPLDEAAVSSIAKRTEAAVKGTAERKVEPVATPTTARVMPFRRRLAFVAGPLAVAAAVALFVSGRGDGTPRLPELTVVASEAQELRGASEPSSRLRIRGGRDASFELVVRPATAVAHVVAYVFARGSGGEPSPVDATVEVAAEGSVRIRGKARALEGARELRIVIGTANGSIKRFDDALARAIDGTSDASIRVLVVPIDR